MTDANLLLGRIDPEWFLGGEMTMHPIAAKQAIDGLASQLGLMPEEAAFGVVKIVNAQMARAIRLVSVARGHDPRDFTLVSFGGAGGLHACEVAREVGIDRVLIPRGASTLSAYGMLAADVAEDFVRTVMLPAETPFEALEKILEPMVQAGRLDIEMQGIPPLQTELLRELDLRYVGQSYELRVPFEPMFTQTFHEKHQDTYGYSDLDMLVEVVNLRVRAIGRVSQPDFRQMSLESEDPSDALITEPAGSLTFYDGERLKPGNRIPGQSIVLFPNTTAYLGSPDHATVDGYGNLLVEVGHK